MEKEDIKDKEIEEQDMEQEEPEVNDELLNEKLENIMKKLESLNVDKEIGEKENNRDVRLIIEKIELENFKSYAGLKRIGPLHYSFNAVVGPNGSGKSNLMESLLFVFGKRAKKMRLNKLNELIHNSSTQNNLRFARVSVYFKEIKDIENDNYEEVPDSSFVLSREVYKNGSSKYLLNNKEINFDNLCVLLNKKGIDLKHNRFLILQGEVEQISMMKPRGGSSGDIGLLEFLEDIIGTTRYVSLIDKLYKDIDELGEIKTQKSNRVKITKNELDQLEDIKNASTEYYKKEKELHIFGHLDFLIKRHQINKQILDYQNRIGILNENLNGVDKKIKEKIEENSNIIEEHRKIKKEQELIKQKKVELNKQADALDEIDKVKRADIENYSKNIGKAKTALEKFNKNYQTQSENIQNAHKEMPKKEKELNELVEAKKRLDKFINEKDQELFEKTEKFQIQKREVEKLLQPYDDKINENKFQIEQNASTINLISQKFEKINSDKTSNTNRKNEIDILLKDKASMFASIEEKLANYDVTFKQAKDNLNRANTELDEKYKKTQSLQARISEIKVSAQEKNQKSNILDQLLRAQTDGKLNGIYGRLGDLGVIDAKYDIAVTTACSNLDSIVVETVDHAQKCLDFLKKNNIGRATFLILEKVAWVDYKMKEQFRPPINCDRLFDLVKVKNQRLNIAFYFALRDTLVAPDLKTATQVGYGSVRNRVVTLNGELIEIAGTMSGGGKPRKGGMSNREVEDYSPDYVNKLNNEYENMVKEFEASKMERNGLENRCNSLNAQIQELLILKNKTENECISMEKALSECNKNLNSFNQEFTKYKKDIDNTENLKNINDELQEKNKGLLSESEEYRKRMNMIEVEISSFGGEDFNKKKEEFKEMKKRIVVLEKEVNNMKHVIDNAGGILEKIKEEIEVKEKVVKEFENHIENIKKELEDLEKQAMEIYGQIDVFNKESVNLENRFTEKSKEVEDLKITIKKMREEKDKINNEIVEINSEIKKLEKSEKLINEDLNKNKKSYKKLVEEFGFIDDFEREIKNINKKKSNEIENDNINENNNLNNINTNAMIVDDNPTEEKEKTEDKLSDNEQEIAPRKTKMRKGVSNIYAKYIEAKYMEYAFKMEELEELSKATKEIAYEYTMLQTKINDMKPNMNAILQYKNKLIELKSREEDMNQTVDKLNKAKQIFDCVKARRYNEFMEGFNVISAKLKEMYQLITNGGDAELELLDSLDPFSEGILFSVRPFKKSWKQISNLSGGEKTLSSLSLIFALHHYKPSPLYVLDEIDAALDFKNVSIIANYIKEQTKNSQFIIISLRNHMFELANKLVGIYKTYDITKCLTFNPESSKLEKDEENK